MGDVLVVDVDRGWLARRLEQLFEELCVAEEQRMHLRPGLLAWLQRQAEDDAHLVAGTGAYADGTLFSGLLGDGGYILIDDPHGYREPTAREMVLVRAKLHAEDLGPYVPVERRSPPERPWLDQRRCRPRKMRRWGKERR